jgi:hypothetical protein
MNQPAYTPVDISEKQSNNEFSRHLLSEDGESSVNDQDFEQQQQMTRQRSRRPYGTIVAMIMISSISIVLGAVIGHYYSKPIPDVDRVCLQRTSRECESFPSGNVGDFGLMKEI